MIACLLLLVTALATARSPGEVVALKRDAGLNTSGSVDSRFTTATVVTTTVNDTALAVGSRWVNFGTSTAPDCTYNLYKFDVSSIPTGARINLAPLRLYHSGGNGTLGYGRIGTVLTRLGRGHQERGLSGGGWRIKETPRKIGDINNNGFVNVGDLQLLVAHWGE